MKILVTGGAGYIGSFMVKRLLQDNHEITVVDSLERGHKEFVDPRANLQVGSILDESFLAKIFSENNFEATIHFAGYISMGESMEKPDIYFNNNTFGTLKLLEAARVHNTKKIIFSSTAGVYGNHTKTPIPEEHIKNPENPYGESKLMVEKLLNWYEKIHGINFVALRYFNASGASLDGKSGEAHDPETHIIPKAIQAALNNSEFNLFGTDYKTNDGTCVRDYIHVIDLVEAHVLALEKLQNAKGGFYYNVGTGKGYSNKEVLEMVKKVTGREFKIKNSPRRSGDADTLIADVAKINSDLKFSPKYSDLETIVKTAWEWHKKNS